MLDAMLKMYFAETLAMSTEIFVKNKVTRKCDEI